MFLDNSDQGLIVTLCAGVTGYKTQYEKEPTLLGVVGTDIAHKLLERTIPDRELGVFGHGIAINNNGILLIHPALSNQHGDNLFSIPGGSVTINLYQAEHAVDKKKIDFFTKKYDRWEVRMFPCSNI